MFRNRFDTGVRPTIGVPSGVIGRRPVQNVAFDVSPPPGNRSFTHISSVSRRASRRRLSKPTISAIPPTRMRWSKRVIAIL
ncbi:hypothetical protein BGV56_15580 [Burkholderia ubonensis]|nr:hypothetical protein BGV56_15580 [Burkholderia ubonensis]